MQRVYKGIAAFFVLVVVLCAWLRPLDQPAIDQVDAGLKRALISFASARALNAAISVAQGTEFSFGVTLAPGQALDPVNDLVEQFSALMLAASVIFGIQKLLISIGAYWMISVVLTISALAWLWWCFNGRQAPPWISGLFAVLLMVRFVMPVVTIGADFMFQKFLAGEYAASQKVIEGATGKIAELDQPNPEAAKERRWWESLQTTWTKYVTKQYEALKAAAEQVVENIIKIMVVFLLQTVVIPFALFWILYVVANNALRRPWLAT